MLTNIEIRWVSLNLSNILWNGEILYLIHIWWLYSDKQGKHLLINYAPHHLQEVAVFFLFFHWDIYPEDDRTDMCFPFFQAISLRDKGLYTEKKSESNDLVDYKAILVTNLWSDPKLLH